MKKVNEVVNKRKSNRISELIKDFKKTAYFANRIILDI